MNLQNYSRSKRNDANAADKLTAVLFVIYVAVLLWIVVFKLGVQFSYMENRNVNLIPFNTLFIPDEKIDFGEMVLNAIIFVPLGLYAGVLFRRWSSATNVLFFFFVSLIFEGIQFLMKIGAFDITDIIINTFGGIIGLLIVAAVEKVFKSHSKAQKFINIVATLGTALVVLLLLLLKLDMLPINYR